MKFCPHCKSKKPLSDFGNDKNRKDGLHPYCKPCWKVYRKISEQKYKGSRTTYLRNYALKKKYGIGIAEYEEMLLAQDGKCWICGKHHSNFPHGLHVDHDHRTGKVRGLLCKMCNTGLGTFGDSQDCLIRAAQYLKEHT